MGKIDITFGEGFSSLYPQKSPNLKREPLDPVDQNTKYQDSIKQMLADILLSTYKDKDKTSTEHINTPWNILGRRKRREKVFGFIKKTVLPFPRLGQLFVILVELWRI